MVIYGKEIFMIKRLQILLLVMVGISVSPLFAVHNDSSSIIPVNSISAGMHLGISTTPGPQTFISTGIGINEWSDLRLRVGYLDYAPKTNSFYSGLYYKVLVTRFFEGMDSISFEVAPQYHQYFSIYDALVLTSSWKNYQFYTGLDDSVYFRQSSPLLKMQFLVGVNAKYDLAFLSVQKVYPTLNFELAVPVVNNTPFVFSLSIQYVFAYRAPKKSDME